MHISPYEQGNRYNVDPVRPSCSCISRKSAHRIYDSEGDDAGSLSVYIDERGRAKMELALARVRKLYDKREDIAKRDSERRMQQAMKRPGNNMFSKYSR